MLAVLAKTGFAPQSRTLPDVFGWTIVEAWGREGETQKNRAVKKMLARVKMSNLRPLMKRGYSNRKQRKGRRLLVFTMSQ